MAEPWVKISATDARRLELTNRFVEQDLRKLGPQLRRRQGLVPASAGSVRRAKAQEGAQDDGRLEVKLLGTDGLVTGDSINIFVFSDGAATDFTSAYWFSTTAAVVATSDEMHIFKDIDNSWYLIFPPLVKITACPA